MSDQPQQATTAPSNGFAIAALVIGVVGVILTLAFRLALICDVLAVVFGALGSARARDGARDGALAKAGMILGLVGLGLLLLLVIFFHNSGLGGHFFRFGHRLRHFG